MFALLRRYLRRVDALYLALCAACSVVSVVVLVSIGQTQLGSNNKASVQLIASFAGHYAGGHFLHGGLSCPGPRLAAACHGGVGTGAAHPVFAQLPGGGSSPSGTMRAGPPITAGIGWAA